LTHLNQNVRGEVASQFDGETLTLEFIQPCDTIDEDSRLREASSFDALRLVQHSFDLSSQDKHAIFLGGLFAYDLVANFEPLGDA
ncbi:anthranilate synthase component I, partial [Escherichia coli]|nr:anthranilate synthase component I [Escherichia coli]